LVILPADRAVTIQSNKLGSPFVYWTFQPAALFLGQDQLTLPFFFAGVLIKVALVLRNCQADKKCLLPLEVELELESDIKQSAHCRACRGAASVLVFHHAQGDEENWRENWENARRTDME